MTPLAFHLIATGFGAVEGPAISTLGNLYVSDLKRGAVFEICSNGRSTVQHERAHVGGIALHDKGGLVLSGTSVVHWTPTATRTLLVLDELPRTDSGRAAAFNDLVAEPGTGSVIVGVLHVDDTGSPVPGRLVRIDGPGQCSVILEGLHPNGLAFSADGATLIAADTYGRRLLTAEVGPGGSLTSSRAISTEATDGFPDGIAVDVDGDVWVAFYRGGCIARVDPSTGQMSIVPFPVSKPLSLAFANPGVAELWVVSGQHPEADEPFGGVWRARAPVTGAPVAQAAI